MAAFTTIAAAASLAATAGTTGMSFIQAGKQRRNQLKAQAEADKAMAEARKRLSVNVYKGLGITKEPYELEREALLAAGAQAIEAAKESERGAAAASGRVQMAQQEAQADVRTSMGKEIQDLNKLVATEEGRLLDVGTELNLAQVEGAQQAARDAEEAKNAAIAQGMQGVVSLGSQLASFAPLYGKAGQRVAGKIEKGVSEGNYYNPLQEPAEGTMGPVMPQKMTTQQYLTQLGPKSGLDLSAVGGMTQDQFKSWLSGVDPDILRKILKGM